MQELSDTIGRQEVRTIEMPTATMAFLLDPQQLLRAYFLITASGVIQQHLYALVP